MTLPADTPGGCRPEIRVIAAVSRNMVIGRDGALPWDIPADRRLFRELTIGNTVVMGRRTYESLPAPLADRHNIVLSRSSHPFRGAVTCRNLLEAIALGWRLGRPICLIGGAELYRKGLLIADSLHISWIEGEYAGDRRFPPIDFAVWRPERQVDFPGFRYVVYRRRAAAGG